MATVTWYETLEYMLNHIEADQRNLSRNSNKLEPAEGCEGAWERTRTMAELIRAEMRDTRYGTKERRGTAYVKEMHGVRSDGMGRGKTEAHGGGGVSDGRGSDREVLPDERGDEEVQQNNVEMDEHEDDGD